MANERNWAAVPVQLLLVDGGQYGQVRVPSTLGIKVKQKVFIYSNLIPAKQELEVKSVLNETDLELGPRSPEMSKRTDLQAYTVATGAKLEAPVQPRPDIVPDIYWRSVFEEEPTVALRTFAVDHLGRRWSKDNPFPVQLSDGSINIGTVNAELEVQLSHKDNDPDAGDVHDSVRIGDGVDEMSVNPDGSINVVVAGSNVSFDLESEYNEVSSVPTASPTLVCAFTAPVGKTTFLHKVFASGDNTATYKVKLNSTTIDTKRTYFGADLDVMFDFSITDKGRELVVGDLVEIYVEHQRPFVGDFNARIQTVQI